MPRRGQRKRNDSAKVALTPQASLNSQEILAYQMLRSQIEKTNGTGISAGDETLLTMAAVQYVRVEELRQEARTAPRTITTGAGTLKEHPVHQALRASERELRTSLGNLCLNPRARKGWRSSPDATAPAPDTVIDDPILKLLG